MTRSRRWAIAGIAAAAWTGIASAEPPAASVSATAASAPARPWFQDVAAAGGLSAVMLAGGRDKDHILESTGSGAAFFDYDGDGRPDIYLVNGWSLDESPSRVQTRGKAALYRNLGGGRFEDVTERAGVGDGGWGCGVCAGDYDNDGHVDLYVTHFGANRLYRNRGDGTFEDRAAPAGVADPGWSAGASFFDADGDGDLDLYVAHYIDCTVDDVLKAERTTTWRGRAKVMSGPFGLRGGRDRFFRNRGDGTFSDATDECGLRDDAEAYGLGVLAMDLDRDGDTDLYIANDSNPNFLYRNDGGGRFTEMGLWSGAGLSSEGVAQAGMGVDAADVDGDGRVDLFVTNFARDYSTLYRQTDTLVFEDVTRGHDVAVSTFVPLSWGCAFFDADLDADVDLFVVNGHIYPQVDQVPELGEHYRQTPLLFENRNGRLCDVTARAWGGSPPAVSGRGLALADMDEDGDLDLLVTAMDSPPLLLRNDAPRSGRWLTVRLLNRRGAPAIGAVAELAAGGVRQQRDVCSGSTYQSQSTFDLHFGLGRAVRVERLEVRWPGGAVSTLRDIEADCLLTLRQPK